MVGGGTSGIISYDQTNIVITRPHPVLMSREHMGGQFDHSRRLYPDKSTLLFDSTVLTFSNYLVGDFYQILNCLDMPTYTAQNYLKYQVDYDPPLLVACLVGGTSAY